MTTGPLTYTDMWLLTVNESEHEVHMCGKRERASRWACLTCDEASLPLERVLAALQQLNKVVKPGGLDMVEAVEETLGDGARETHNHGRGPAPQAIGPALRVLAMSYGRHGSD